MVAGSFAFGFALVPLYRRDLRGGRHPRERHAVRAPSHREAGAGAQGDARIHVACGAGQRLRARARDAASWCCSRARLYGGEVPHPQQCLAAAWSRRRCRASRRSPRRSTCSKTECFCFTPQHFGAAEEREFVGAVHRRPGPADAGRPDDARLFVVCAACTEGRGALNELTGPAARRPALSAERTGRPKTMAQAHAAHGGDKYYIPHGSKWPIVGSVALFTTMVGVSSWLNGVHVGPWVFYAGLRDGGVHVLRLVRHRHRREPGRALQRRRRPLVPHGNDVVHHSPR